MPLGATTRFDMRKLNSQTAAVPELIAIKLAANTTFRLGESLMETGTIGVYTLYDGATAEPRGLLTRACVTDANGKITFGAQAGGGEFGQLYDTADMAISGVYATLDLPQAGNGSIHTDSVTNGNAHQFARLVQGTLASGLIKLL